ncbi:GntR family transcriptional regulator [Jiella sonneratiae]|uniref:GntR family transcriptional regulator n=1 Tax=Jiella sonneratiae TaxID=2816856 RepID=A0ABS3J558_9HYPH|nr:GntR family transcriptional regulator [Jiella sonneratiae]MBO0904809.1 GntR family transcriptional regulator [Jiella sonneratiae]
MARIEDKVVPLRRETLQTGVYTRLCDLILQGGIAPGESITVASLASAFGVSPMPVREALTRLTAAGALTVVSGRTIGVPKLTRERLDDLRRVRLEIEPIAAEWAAGNVDDAFIAEMDRRYRRLVESEAAADAKMYVEANYAFHFAVYRQSGSPTMFSIIESLWLQVSPFFHLLRESGNFRISNDHHAKLFEAMSKGDGTAARAAITSDVNDAYAILATLV